MTIASTIGNYTALPIFKLLASTSRTRFPVAADTVDLMHREVTAGLEKFLKDNRGQPAVYIHGPQGVGKSFSLYEVVCRFRSQANTRVVYIPDCGGWGALMQEESVDEAISFLLYAILLAFPDDASIEQRCLDCELEQQSVVALLKVCKILHIRVYANLLIHSISLYIVKRTGWSCLQYLTSTTALNLNCGLNFHFLLLRVSCHIWEIGN